MPPLRLRRRLVVPGLGALVTGVLLASCSTPAPARPSRQFSSPAAIQAAARHPGRLTNLGAVSGRIRAPGGPYLYDSSGRVILFHGVNAVYKYAPFELYPDPGQPWNFSAADAREIAGLGFDVVRLGITWQGLEPNGPGPNDPSICRSGTPSAPHLFDPVLARTYLNRLTRTVDLLGRYHIYVLLDMHQDAYSQPFRGEGAPPWAVCTDTRPVWPLDGRWSHNYRNPALAVAESHFWLNDVVGDLQGQYDYIWGVVAKHFANNPWILGYDPYNEPFSTKQIYSSDLEPFAVDLECFYTGRAHPGVLEEGIGPPISCPADDPAEGVIPTIEKADPHHLVFFEPDNYAVRHGGPSLLGPMGFPRLVYNFHVYCGNRSPITGDPNDLTTCVNEELANISQRHNERPDLSTPLQPGGPAWFMSEFGASHDTAMLQAMTGIADTYQLGWTYWSWKYYTDPTGSSSEPLAHSDGTLYPSAAALTRAYPQAIAGVPLTISYHVSDGSLELLYAPSHTSAPTVLFVPGSAYPYGYCASVNGGTILSAPGDPHLQIQANGSAATVAVFVHPGRCQRSR